jgi:hypothetical protein
MVEQGVLNWFEQILARVPEFMLPHRINGLDETWS